MKNDAFLLKMADYFAISRYTNGIAVTVLDFALEVADLLDETPSANWSSVSERLYLPIVDVPAPGFMAGTPVHTEYHGYNQTKRLHINQADVTLLQYPLGLRSNKRIFPSLPNSKNPDTQLAINDLLFWQPKSDNQVFYTGDSSNSIAWLEMGNRSAADAQFDLAFTHMDLKHFNVFEERNTGTFGHLNFITGAGGYQQNVVNGYLGLRYTKDGVDLRPVLPPHGVTSVKLRGLSLAGSRIDLLLGSEAVTLMLVEGPGATVRSQGVPDAKLLPDRQPVTIKLCKGCGCGCPGGGCGCLSVVPGSSGQLCRFGSSEGAMQLPVLSLLVELTGIPRSFIPSTYIDQSCWAAAQKSDPEYDTKPMVKGVRAEACNSLTLFKCRGHTAHLPRSPRCLYSLSCA